MLWMTIKQRLELADIGEHSFEKTDIHVVQYAALIELVLQVKRAWQILLLDAFDDDGENTVVLCFVFH